MYEIIQALTHNLSLRRVSASRRRICSLSAAIAIASRAFVHPVLTFGWDLFYARDTDRFVWTALRSSIFLRVNRADASLTHGAAHDHMTPAPALILELFTPIERRAVYRNYIFGTDNVTPERLSNSNTCFCLFYIRAICFPTRFLVSFSNQIF